MVSIAMPLHDYRAKRDFTRSPEPKGKDRRPAPRGQRRFFCVQKHLATQLHYDLRLEHDGVLLSWAVPKGPSIDPRDKRFAVHVEDHPLEYGEFEGVIPEGYGAGVVLLWDRGTWEPLDDDVGGGLERGDLKFRLDGYKLKGSWALVRTRGMSGGARGTPPGRSWLLLKHRDEWAGPVEIAAFAPRSVKSGGDFDDVLAENAPEVWFSGKSPGRRVPPPDALSKILAKVERYKEARDQGGNRRTTGATTKTTTAGRKTARTKSTAAGTKAAEKRARPKAARRTTSRAGKTRRSKGSS